MNRRRVFLEALALSALLAAPLARAQSPALDNRKLALHKTYLANQVTSFPTGTAPTALAFDGEHMWIANSLDNNVMKLNVNTGQVLATYRTGLSPAALAFDGFNMWVACSGDGLLYKLRASDGTPRLTVPFATPRVPTTVVLVFDGANIWVSSLFDKKLMKLRASDGTILGTFNIGSVDSMLFDGQYIWIASGGGVLRLRASDGSRADIPSPSCLAVSLTYDGTYIYAGCEDYGVIKVLRASDGVVVNTVVFESSSYQEEGAPYPAALAFDGTYVWAAVASRPTAANQTGEVVAIRPGDGTVAGIFTGTYIEGQPYGFVQPGVIAFDGTNMWLVDLASDSVTKL